MIAGSTALALRGGYPWWLVAVAFLMFAQFVVSSGLGRLRYDPLGKYDGAFLFAALAAIITMADLAVQATAAAAMGVLSVVTLASRALILAGRRDDPKR